MSTQRREITLSDGSTLVAERRSGGGPTVILLHAGVADRRSWAGVADALAEADLDLVAYDRRGFGETPAAPAESAFTHLGDLVELLDALEVERAVVVGNSMGGALALDLAATAPGRVSGLLLIGAAVSGMTDDDTPFDWQADPATARLMAALEDAESRGDVAARIDALTRLWLDGPTAEKARVGDPARALFADMNRVILDSGADGDPGDAGLDTWRTLDAIGVPVLASWGELDIPADLPFYEETARRLGQGPGRVLPGAAHLPGLERPEVVAGLVLEVAGRA